MQTVLIVAQALAGIGSLICCILVWVKMFQHGDTTRGIIYIVTTVFCGIGALLTLLWGVRKQREWQLQKVMNTWAVCIVVAVLAVLGQFVLGPRS